MGEAVLLAPSLALAKTAGALARRAGRGGGSSLPGKILTRLAPEAIGTLAARLPEGSAVVSATNGKTTTAAMAATILRRRGTRVVSNRTGANMAGGVASALAQAARRGGRRLDGELGLFEVDEFWLGRVVPQLGPRALLLANLFRDQLDRYGELETIADRWATLVATLPADTALVLNADDPAVAELGRGVRARVTCFGIEDDGVTVGELQHASDSKHCRRCGHTYEYSAVYLAHLGRYRCPSCGLTRPRPDVFASDIALHGVRSAAFTLHLPAQPPRVVELPLPGLYNVYNALAAAALARALGATADEIAGGLSTVEAAFGRAERVVVDGRDVSLLLVKNPAGANEVLRTLSLERDALDLLGVLNDRIADGRDVSWVWDADWELVAGRLRRMTCAGTRAAELALRLKYAGVPEERLHVVEDLADGLDAALAGGEGPLYALPTYTAMTALHRLLSDRGAAPRYWEAAA